MKKIISGLFLSCVLSIPAMAQYESPLKIGDAAPEIAFNNPEDKPLKLSEINNGRVVLLDFWASWCGPCRRANPRLVELYKKYKDQKIPGAKKGFTIMSVSLDQKKEAWGQAIAHDSLAWPYHVSDLGGWEAKPAQDYGVRYIPQAFLVGPDGKIIGKYQFAEEAAQDIEKIINSKGKKDRKKAS